MWLQPKEFADLDHVVNVVPRPSHRSGAGLASGRVADRRVGPPLQDACPDGALKGGWYMRIVAQPDSDYRKEADRQSGMSSKCTS